jgi:outer membrane protein assembly factor BamB
MCEGQHRTSRIHLVPLAMLLSVAGAAGAVGAEDWPGWRGLAREGRGASATAPLHWSATDNVLWRTALPGEGYSSPIVSGDAVYVTVAEEVKAPARLLSGARVATLLAALLITLLAMRLAAARLRISATFPDLLHAVGLLALAGCLDFLILYGETVLDFGKALERPWMAAVLASVWCLALARSSAADGSRFRVWGAVGLLALAVVALVCLPDRAHAFEGGPYHPKSLFLAGLIALPAAVGLGLLAGGATRRGRLWRVVLPCAALVVAASAGGLLAKALITAQSGPRGGVSVSQPYTPHLQWWLPVGLAVLTAFLLGLHRRWQRSLLPNVGAAVVGAALVLVGVGYALEQLTARVFYLGYLAQFPGFVPLLGPWAPRVFGVVCLLGVATCGVARRRHQTATGQPSGTALGASAIALGLLYFVYALYIPKDALWARGVVCLDRATGAVRWQTMGLRAPRGIMNTTDNSAATPTPVSDGERIHAYFGSAGLMAVDLQGRLLWTDRQFLFESNEGAASSPIAWRGEVILLCESRAGAYLAALDGATGRRLWKTPRHQKMHPYAGNCRTPSVMRLRGRVVVVVFGREDASGYAADTGAELWSHGIRGVREENNPVASAVSDASRLYLVGLGQTVALTLDRLGKPGSPVAWVTPVAEGAQCPSPVLAHGLLFDVSDTGTVFCHEAATGKLLWSRNLARQHYASPVAVGNRVYFCDTQGTTTVFAAERTCRLVAQNPLGERVLASFAPVNGKLFVRTDQHLYCLAENRR